MSGDITTEELRKYALLASGSRTIGGGLIQVAAARLDHVSEDEDSQFLRRVANYVERLEAELEKASTLPQAKPGEYKWGPMLRHIANHVGHAPHGDPRSYWHRRLCDLADWCERIDCSRALTEEVKP